MINKQKHLRIHQPLALALLVMAVIAGCGSTVDDQDAGPQCPAGKVFEHSDFRCGKASSAGLCTTPSTNCQSWEPATCGCDGVVYQNVCEALHAGVDFGLVDQCTAPPDMFACEYYFCPRNTTFCNEIPYESEGYSDFSCEPMPPECASVPSCECLLKSHDECEDDGMGMLHATEPSYTD